MNKKQLISWIIAVIGMLFIIAFYFDSVSAVRSARSSVDEVDRELKLQEDRYLRELSSFSSLPENLNAALQLYLHAEGVATRHQAFNDLVIQGQRYLLGKDPSANQLERKILDEIAGALNRRQIAERHYEEALTDCNEVLRSLRGTIGMIFTGGAAACD